MTRGAWVAVVVLLAGCEGEITGSREDASGSSLDAGGLIDAAIPPGVDAYVPPAVDAYVARPDTGPPDPYVCDMGAALAEPIAGCMPATMPSTGDAHEDCVRRINQFRCECQHLPPLMRWVDGEACADMMAQYDHDHPGEAHAAFRAGICSGGYGQNECPGWGSIPQTISGCLQQMWDEGPGDFYGPPPHGHYINMSSTSFTMVACGFYEGSGGVYAVQNFR